MDACIHSSAAAHAALTHRLIEQTAALADAHDFAVDALHVSAYDPVIAVSFVLSKLPRRVVDEGLGEVFLNEDTAMTDRGRCDGSLVALFPVDDRCAVLDAARGHGERGAGDDAYLNGVAYVFDAEHQARCFAEACALKVRRRAVAGALRRALQLAAPLPVRIAARTLVEAFDEDADSERRAWLHELRWTMGHPELDAMRRERHG